MTDIAIIEQNEDVYDKKDVELTFKQLSFFGETSPEDVRKLYFC
jgi:hypothetical protein